MKYKIKIRPLSKFDKREDVANDQFYLRPDGRLFIVYDDDHDDELEDGSHPLHDVTDLYEVTIDDATDAANTTPQPSEPQTEAEASTGQEVERG